MPNFYEDISSTSTKDTEEKVPPGDNGNKQKEASTNVITPAEPLPLLHAASTTSPDVNDQFDEEFERIFHRNCSTKDTNCTSADNFGPLLSSFNYGNFEIKKKETYCNKTDLSALASTSSGLNYYNHADPVATATAIAYSNNGMNNLTKSVISSSSISTVPPQVASNDCGPQTHHAPLMLCADVEGVDPLDEFSSFIDRMIQLP